MTGGFWLFFFKKDLSWKYPHKSICEFQHCYRKDDSRRSIWVSLGWGVIIVMFCPQNCMQQGGCLHKIALNRAFLPFYCYQLSGNQDLI